MRVFFIFFYRNPKSYYRHERRGGRSQINDIIIIIIPGDNVRFTGVKRETKEKKPVDLYRATGGQVSICCRVVTLGTNKELNRQTAPRFGWNSIHVIMFSYVFQLVYSVFFFSSPPKRHPKVSILNGFLRVVSRARLC